MPEVRIRRLETQYRLPAAALGEQRRLDQVGAIALDKSFAVAMVRAGLPASTEVCIRSLFVPVHVRLGRPDLALIEGWSEALASQITPALQNHSTSNVVLYHSRRQALIDLALGVARGDLRRAWAWRQMGLWEGNGATSEGQSFLELVRCLCREPEMIIPVLRAIAEAGQVQCIASSLTDTSWEELAGAASSVITRIPEVESREQLIGLNSSRVINAAMRVLKNSELFRATSSSWLSRASVTVQRAFAVLVVLEAEPLLLRTEAAPAILARISEAFYTDEPTFVERGPFTETSSSIHEKGPDAQNLVSDQQREEASQPVDLRRRAFTRYGGLLFLIGLIDDLGLPEEIAQHPVLNKRSFPWVMQQLALLLAPVDPNDPVALAFVGLAPGSTPPRSDEGAPDDLESQALNNFVERIVARLVELNLFVEPLETPPADVLTFVIARRAEIVAEPGWIEARFSLDQVSTAIRRAGLDLDPGYVPWLGIVLKFVYE